MRRGPFANQRRASSALFCLVLLGLTLGALGHVAVQAKTFEIAVLLGKERALHEQLLGEQRHLQIEIGQLKDPARLVRLAETRLGMTPQPAEIRVVAVAPPEPPTRKRSPR